MSKNKIQANTSLYNNRKVKPSKTGQFTIRELKNGKYIVIAHFEGWKKSHAIDFGTGEPYEQGREYPTFPAAMKACKKYGLNMLPRPHLKKPLAKRDYYYDMIHPLEKSVTYK